jgi:Protein of unknown function (DUF1595)
VRLAACSAACSSKRSRSGSRYGRRLFRRAITSAEHDRYLSFFDSALGKSNFKSAIKWLTVGLIQSPNAVYRSEIGTLAIRVRLG